MNSVLEGSVEENRQQRYANENPSQGHYHPEFPVALFKPYELLADTRKSTITVL
jgi:hypothetical protein